MSVFRFESLTIGGGVGVVSIGFTCDSCGLLFNYASWIDRWPQAQLCRECLQKEKP